MLRVLCYGGRHYAALECVDWALSLLAQKHGEMVIINGGARGADALCKQWGLRKGRPVITMDAAWDTLGKMAGHTCNQWMLDYAAPNYALAFPGGTGTADMTRRVKLAGLPLWEPFK